MDIVLLELLLWAGLICFLWVMKDSLGKIESELEKSAAQKAAGRARHDDSDGEVRPNRLFEPIGSLGNNTIYRFAIIDGKTYEFDHVATGKDARLAANERWLPPGLVYKQSDEGADAAQG